MEVQHLVEVLRATIDPISERRRAAEYQLSEMSKIAGFAPTILQIVMVATVEQPVRQAGVVYLKHLIYNCWLDYTGKPIPFSLYEQDRAIIRGVIMDAIVHAPELIRVQLSMCMNHIIGNDFPERWPELVNNIGIYLQNEDVNCWNGALVTVYQLVKIYEDKHKIQKPMYEAMSLLLPVIYQLMVRLLTEQSVQSTLLQKQILKIYYSLTRYNLPLELMSKEIFSQWMEICLHIADCEVPDSSHLDGDERTEFPYWKTKKWALHIMVNIFKCYINPFRNKYKHIAKWYQQFSPDALKVLMKILNQYRNQVYVSPRVLSDVLQYLRRAACYSYTWQLIKSYMEVIILEVIFPIMSFSKSDQALWDTDPSEFIRLKFDNFSEYTTPVPAAQSLLLFICKKRRGILPMAISVIIRVITSPDANNNQKDGALHMIGILADLMLKKALYCNQVEFLLSTYVLPEFQNPAGHMRARASWVINCFCKMQFTNPEILAGIMRLTINALLTDKEMPVKVEAAISLHRFLSFQDEAEQYVVDQLMDITKELLSIIRETEIEDLLDVMQGFVCTFTQQLLPVATEICQHLAITFNQVIESENGCNERTQMAWSLLATFDVLLSAMEKHPDVLFKLQPIVTNLVINTFQHNITDLYEVTFELVYDLTTKAISPEMWQMLELIYQVFKRNGIDYFANIMPVLHNYVTVDTPSFLSNPNMQYVILDMCRTILTSCPGENPEWYAAKLMEVLILQCKGQIDELMHTFVEVSLSRLRREVQSSELRTMCLQVVIAALFKNPQLLLSILDNMSQQSNESISAHFIRQWLQDTEFFLGIHDRKLCVLGLCTLISLGDAKPEVLYEVAGKILPALILLINGLERAYLSREKEEDEEEYEEEEDSDLDLSSDKDDMDEMELEETSDDESEVDSEVFTTSIDDDGNKLAIDEYWTFKEVITALPANDQAWYALLTSNLTPAQANELQAIVRLADYRKASNEIRFQ